MKFVHLSDLHLGKRVNGFSMVEEQRDSLTKILAILDREQPQAVLIAGDVYDRAVPSTEAVSLFDDFLVQLARRKLSVLLISGNHDSPERLAFGGRLLERSGVHLSPVYRGQVEPVVLEDQYGPVLFYLLPFLKPAQVRPFFPEREINSYDDAAAAAIDAMEVPEGARCVLLAHQFVTGAVRSESEELSVGGTDNVNASRFDPFDYVALGHLHAPQKVGRETLRYCGAPLQYAFSEVGEKSLTVVELAEKGVCTVAAVPLEPRHRMLELRGLYDTVTSKAYYEARGCQEDYVHIILTDEEDIPEAVHKLKTVYPRLMKLSYDNHRTRAIGVEIPEDRDVRQQDPLELLESFYEAQNGQAMGQEQREFSRQLLERIWEEEP